MEQINDEVEINLSELFLYLKKKIAKIIIVMLVFMVAAAAVTIFLIPKKYQSTARIFPKIETTSGAVSSYSEINSNSAMINNYVEIMKGNTVLTQVAEKLELEKEDLSDIISVSNQSDTMIISVTATTTDPELSKQIVDTTLEVFYSEVKEKLSINNIMTIDSAEVAKNASSPSFIKNVGIAGAFGLVISCGYYFIKFMLDTHIHNKDEAEKYLEVPVLGVIPYFEDK